MVGEGRPSTSLPLTTPKDVPGGEHAQSTMHIIGQIPIMRPADTARSAPGQHQSPVAAAASRGRPGGQARPLRDPEIPCQPQVRIRGDRSFAEHDFVEPSRRHPDRTRKAILRQTYRLDELKQQNLSGGGVGNLPGGSRRFRHGRDLLLSRRSRCAIAD